MEITIWRENETFVYVTDGYRGACSVARRTFAFSICVDFFQLDFMILGETDSAILETATFFCSLRLPEDERTSLQFNKWLWDYKQNFPFIIDFASLRDDQLIRILESNPTRQLELGMSSWSPEQAKILATRSFPLNLKFGKAREGWIGVGPRDDGTVFMNYLETRHTHFGSLTVGADRFNTLDIRRNFLERIINLEGMFDKLTIGFLCRENVILPLSAKAHALDYQVPSRFIQPSDFDSLDIPTMKLSLTFYGRSEELLIPFCNRVAQLGHFQRLQVSVESDYGQIEASSAAAILQALIRAIRGNPLLTQLTLKMYRIFFSLGSHVEELFQVFGEHKRLRTIRLYPFPPVSAHRRDNEFEEMRTCYYPMLERLLIQNRNLVILGLNNKRLTNGTTIDEIYAQNYIYTRFIKIAEEPTSLRPSLVATALTECATSDFPYKAQLMTFHIDMLCELLKDVSLNDDNDAVAVG
ncbi:hypothetical protein FisN_10Lu409 [Fistulifera solaris]|uniref:Uncharacterized protein n=1 Tax=Fistulifera solaris TaxID=1519565 RepID=A0A1Z5JUZ6_FISSO|nr:hypothetical protein FisN_10Lu409 [Fistulifera solaris]|eukprot:GAX17686.1 hypothetical protein FisN_10Lu409 [Fistulifera solaris]